MCSGWSTTTSFAVSGISRGNSDSLNDVGYCNKVMNITIYMLPDMLSLISHFFQWDSSFVC